MRRWLVICGYRKDGGQACSLPTHSMTVVVEADDEDEAREEAIDAVYDNSALCSHVQPFKPHEIIDTED